MFNDSNRKTIGFFRKQVYVGDMGDNCILIIKAGGARKKDKKSFVWALFLLKRLKQQLIAG